MTIFGTQTQGQPPILGQNNQTQNQGQGTSNQSQEQQDKDKNEPIISLYPKEYVAPLIRSLGRKFYKRKGE